MSDFSIPLGTGAAYKGAMTAQVFEGAPPDEAVPTNHIRTTQAWGVEVKWKMEGAFVPFLVDQFQLRTFIESIGPGLEAALPIAGPVVVGTLSAPLQPGNVREYTASVSVPAGTVPAGVYKVVTVVQLHDDAPPASPYPIVATVEGPILTFFNPA